MSHEGEEEHQQGEHENTWRGVSKRGRWNKGEKRSPKKAKGRSRREDA